MTTRGALRALATAVLVSGLGMALLAAPTPAVAGDEPGPDFNRPEVGACYKLFTKHLQRASNSTPPTLCSGPHSTETIKVFQLPASISYDDPDAVHEITSKRCWRAFNSALGATDRVRSTTAYRWYWFSPTPSEQNQGARWIRCDIVVEGRNQPRQTYGPLEPLGANIPGHVRACSATKVFRFHSCADGRTFSVSGTLQMSGKGYPSRKKFIRKAKQCEKFAKGKHWIGDWPDEFQWKHGRSRTVVCYRSRK